MSRRSLASGALIVALAACGGGGANGMPAGDHVHSLGATPDGGLLLGLHGGLFASQDGVAWDLVGLDGEDAMVIASAAGEPVFVAGHDVLYRSDDGGETFSPLDPVDLPGLDIHGFAQAPTDGQAVYAYVVGHGLFASGDGGETWEQRASIDSMPAGVFGLAVVGSGDQTVVMVGPESGAVRSEDGGRTFESVYDVPAGAVVIDRSAPDDVWVLTAGGLARSEDAGRSWETVSTLEGVTGQPAALAVDQGRIWMVTEQPRALYRSDDVGVSWDRVAGA